VEERKLKKMKKIYIKRFGFENDYFILNNLRQSVKIVLNGLNIRLYANFSGYPGPSRKHVPLP
jgi:hypothetical protein